ncbi:MAG: isopenicillin N synthase family oxygenase, partial [Myxococcales bacterium]|nr:isopenicillin N synthase family oxygenase [Myxococcales bacterium]
MAVKNIPIIELGGRGADELRSPISQALSDLGFVALRGHGIDAALVSEVYRVVRAFFALPADTKLRYHLPDGAGARGYTPFGIEKAKDQTVADLKEFWHVGRELPESERQAAQLPPNVWPDEIPGFREATLALWRALDALGSRVLSAVALGLQQDARYFDRVIDRGNSILRPLCYPPIASAPAGAVRSAAHEDINLITLLVGSAEPGLQILARDGVGVDARSGEGLGGGTGGVRSGGGRCGVLASGG